MELAVATQWEGRCTELCRGFLKGRDWQCGGKIHMASECGVGFAMTGVCEAGRESKRLVATCGIVQERVC